jgi:hypothetical protein
MSGTTILISPLNWGFGHAGRMIPLALELKEKGSDVVFGADTQILPLIEQELPGIRLIEIPGLHIRYSRFLPQYLCIFLQLPAVVISAFREHFALRRIVREINPAVIISDNRFGLFHPRIFSVYVTHQLRIPFPQSLRFMEPFTAWLHRKIINRYDLCLVPDYPGEVNLSGRLSHGLKAPVNLPGRLSHGLKAPGNVHYMGPLSRFRTAAPSEAAITPCHPYCCLILSGPEPQRTMLLEKVATALPGIQLCVLSAAPVKMIPGNDPFLTLIIRPCSGTMRQHIEGSSLVITRAGYTSVMELVSLGKGAVLIPTPGQPEQEYLGDWLNGHHGFITVKQQNIGSLRALAERFMTDTVLNEIPSPQLPDNVTEVGNSPPQLSDAVPAVTNSSPQLPDGTGLFEQAISLLLEQKKQ